MKPDEWDSLGWHHQEALLEGLEDEGLVTRGDNASGTDFDIDLSGDDDLDGTGFSVESI